MKTVADMLGIKQQHARTLLIHARWDVERLCGNFAEKGKERLFVEAGLPSHASSVRDCSNGALAQLPHPFTCETCFDEVSPHAVTTMDCGHSFCNDCKATPSFPFPFPLSTSFFYALCCWTSYWLLQDTEKFHAKYSRFW
jgi:ariadne-1